MGLFDSLEKMFKGEPLHGTSSPDAIRSSAAPDEAAAADPTRHTSGHKVIPQVRVTRLHTRRNGATMTTHVWLQNDAPFAIELRGFRIMGRTTAMNDLLQPGQGREIRIYRGAIARHDKETAAHVDYRIAQNGDYFQQQFFVEFDRQADGMFLIEELHPESHVRDT